MRAAILIVCAVLACAAASAKEAVWAIPATVTTSAVTRTSDCQAFVGDLDEVTLYGATSATGTISIALVDPYNSSTLVIATNAALTTGKKVWRPRIAAPVVAGASALTVTNSGDRFYVSGETLRASLAGVTGTNAVIRFRVKYIE